MKMEEIISLKIQKSKLKMGAVSIRGEIFHI